MRKQQPIEAWQSSWRRWSSTGRFTPMLIGLLCLLLIGAALERGRGNFHKLSTAVDPDDPREALRAVSPGPGGQAPVRLSRTATAIGGGPEFLSVTLLPGRGMNVYQITANVPGHGEVKLLVSPPIQGAEAILTGAGDDAHGAASTSLGGAILVPWAGQLVASPAGNGTLQTTWESSTLRLPGSPRGGDRALDGLLLDRAADQVRTDVLPDGQAAEATFDAGSFKGAWPSSVQVQVRAELTASALDLTVTAKNAGDRPMTMGIGWHPYFAIPSGDRASARLHIPAQAVLEVDARTGLPTGRVLPVRDAGSTNATEFQGGAGDRLGSSALDSTYTNLMPPGEQGQAIAELSDPADNLGIRLFAETANIRFLQVTAPADQRWVNLGPSTNADDPLGQQWGSTGRSGWVRLAPGETLQWKVRLEVFALSLSKRP